MGFISMKLLLQQPWEPTTDVFKNEKIDEIHQNPLTLNSDGFICFRTS